MDMVEAARHGPSQIRSLDDCEQDYQPSSSQIVPGYYGQFPSKFNVYWAGLSEDQMSRYFVLGEDPSSLFQSFTWHEEKRQHKLTLHSALNTNLPPIALCGGDPLFNSDSILVLPAAKGQNKNYVLQRMITKTEGRSIAHTFDIPINDGSHGSSSNKGTFTWRCKNQYLPPLTYELVESTSATQGSGLGSSDGEVLAKWTEDMLTPDKAPNGNMGGVEFYGKGSTGEMGDYWHLSVIVALLRLSATHWDASLSTRKIMDRVFFVGKVVFYVGTFFGFGYLVRNILGWAVLCLAALWCLIYFVLPLFTSATSHQ